MPFLNFLNVLLIFTSFSFSSEVIKFNTELSALKQAEMILVNMYGKKVLSQKPFQIISTKDTWIIDGTFHCPENQYCLGGTAHLEFFKKDGKIKNIIHGK
jgi:hypothetical protein